MSTIAVNEITKADGTGSLSVPAESGTVVTTASPSLGRRNLIINGAMQVAQRGTSQTSDGYGSVDRYAIGNGTDGTYTLEQSTDAPDDFKYSLKFTTGTADASLASGQWVSVWQRIEGQNIAHLNYGSSAAKTVTLSFWAKSSLTGSFGGSFVNSANNRSYPFSYSISSANTWEYKTVTISGDTTGTWLDTNGIGIRLFWGLGIGSDRSGTDGSWVADELMAPTGSVSVIGTSGATWQITGVQLEVGSVASSYEHRSYGEELALCQRYYYQMIDGAVQPMGVGSYTTASRFDTIFLFPQEMRATPSIEQTSGTNYYFIFGQSDFFNGPWTLGGNTNKRGAQLLVTSGVSATAHQSGIVTADQSAARIGFNAEL